MTEETQSLNAAFVEEGAFSVSFFQKRNRLFSIEIGIVAVDDPPLQ